MSEERLKQAKALEIQSGAAVVSSVDNSTQEHTEEKTSSKPENQLSGSLLGWYSVLSSKSIKDGELYHFSMYNEPLIIYRDKDSRVRCIKDLCPHRGASFLGGKIVKGELVCPYHGGRFSAEGECTNLDRLTCQHIIDSNYNNYAKRIHLYQYPCVEQEGYIYIYYSGTAKTNLEDFEIKSSLKDSQPSSYGFKPNEYKYEEVYVDFKCDWARIIENHLDILHIFWIHGDTIPDKDVNRKAITSFNQTIKRSKREIESKYSHKTGDKEEFITLKFIPPGRVCIYKGNPDSARYIQILDHVPLGRNRARVIVRHYRKFLKNKFLTKLIMFKPLQHRIFYKIFSEDYLVLKTQSFNEQMGYIKKDNVKLLGEDKMIQYYWDWYQNALNNERPWDIHHKAPSTNNFHEEAPMLYPPENPKLSNENSREITIQLILRLLIPLGLIILII